MTIMTLESNEVVGGVEMQAAAGHLAVEYNAFAAPLTAFKHRAYLRGRGIVTYSCTCTICEGKSKGGSGTTRQAVSPGYSTAGAPTSVNAS